MDAPLGLPIWCIWVSCIVLLITLAAGLPLNFATIVIFLRRKKLRHLVNFVLILDCFSHIVVCIVCIPIFITTAWTGKLLLEPLNEGTDGLSIMQQVARNFANLLGTFLTLSIAILRYRRLCWKKKDKFGTSNALKWSISNVTFALGITILQVWGILQFKRLTALSNMMTLGLEDLENGVKDNQIKTKISLNEYNEAQSVTLLLYAVKTSLIIFSIIAILFCYIRVSQRVWANTTSQEKVMDPMKLKKSRTVHRRATVHSCVQICLILVTLLPHLYEETYEALHFFPSASNTLSFAHKQSQIGNPNINFPTIDNYSFHTEYSTPNPYYYEKNSWDKPFYNWTNRSFDNTTRVPGPRKDLDSSNPSSNDKYTNHLMWRLLGLTLNYSLLILGTPLAYIASCHRFREQFLLIVYGRLRFSISLFQNISFSGQTSSTKSQRRRSRTLSSTQRQFVINHANSNTTSQILLNKNKKKQAHFISLNETSSFAGRRTKNLRNSSMRSISTTGTNGSSGGPRSPCFANFRSYETKIPHHLQATITKSTADIISTLTLHDYHNQTLILSNDVNKPVATSQLLAPTIQNGFPCFNSRMPNYIISENPSVNCNSSSSLTASNSSSISNHSCNLSGSNGTKQFVFYNYSPSGSVSDIYGNMV